MWPVGTSMLQSRLQTRHIYTDDKDSKTSEDAFADEYVHM